MSFQTEYRLARIRRRGITLWFGYLFLALGCAVFGFVSLRTLDSWLAISGYVIAGVIIAFGWLFPAWRYATNFVDITTSRVIQRGGPFARVRREVSTSAVNGVEYQRGSGVAILVRDSDPILLRKVARPKALAADLQETLAK